MANKIDFDALYDWWETLDENRRDRARLRRCRSIDDVLLDKAYHTVRKKIAPDSYAFSETQHRQLGAVIGLLAHVRDDAPDKRFAEQMAALRPGGDRARVSGLRFRRLLAAEDRDELYAMLIRLIPLVDPNRRVNVRSLAKAVYYWSNSVRKRWALDYYQHAPGEA